MQTVVEYIIEWMDRMKCKRSIFLSLIFFAAFALWTILICTVDVQSVGPDNSSVGFATINKYIHNLTGVNMLLYHITDWMGLIPISFMIGFAAQGLIQWFKRRHLIAVDSDILLLGAYYLVVCGVYFLFEYVVINNRPVLINGYLEASYPSSTTLLVLCIMPTATIQLNPLIRNGALKKVFSSAVGVFSVCMLLGRVFSGVHWITDIIGSILISIGLINLYRAFLPASPLK